MCKHRQPSFITGLMLAALLLLSEAAFADAEVTRTNGSWWTRVDGVTVYQGNRFFDAVNAAANNMGAGTINIRNSGDSGPDGGAIYSIRPQANQTLNFHGHRITANGGELVVPIYCDRRHGITVRNVHIVGNPRYGIWFRGCSDVTLENITMDLTKDTPVGLGIRVDASTGPARNLTIAGTININGARGHGIETYGVEGFSIGDVTVTNNGGSGLLLNNSRDGTVGNVVGYYNNQHGGYATFRVANNNGPNIRVNSVYSRFSGRGFFSVTGSHDTRINYVDIANTNSHGIFLEDAHSTHVLSGTVNNGRPNCQLVRTQGSSIHVTGCTPVGTPPSGGGQNNSIIDGIYRIVPVHSGKALDVNQCQQSNGSNIQQWDWLNNNCQKWRITPVDGDFHRISPMNAPDKAIDINAAANASGANAMLWQYHGGHNQQFRFQVAGNGRWRLVNRNSSKCLDIDGNQQQNGANLLQWDCLPGELNQMFELLRQ
ncbi:RICIN domain-containing protein [Alkalimonas sp. MEB108]|uniref:RICIN domain-containing protein n=1 Tax=Alkalimonas cellulosilytica TaxID=3058395 RepID=A0ABU7J7E5_9GAMM|nr:RICIN domain-containing protein [Alkalimonas sp. MEB108]MEE2002382.1 RICIN domain-containing protein [Alkalimonas sp. MEB108]